MDLFLFDDRIARAWAPLTTTRPAGELRYGGHTLRARAERFAAATCSAHLVPGPLAAFDEPGAPPGLDASALEPADRPRLLLSARAVPDPGLRFTPPATSGVVRIGQRAAGWYIAPGDRPPPPDAVQDPESVDAPTAAAFGGHVLDRPWQLISGTPDQIGADFAAAGPAGMPVLPAGVHVIGDAARLRIASSATLEPGVVLDVTHGPIHIGDSVTVRAFTRLAGPSWIAGGTALLGGRFEAVSIGPVCKVHGEVEESVFAGWSNKAHDGFLGHAYAGPWVNLGALTTNSDLKNNYGTIRLWTPGGEVDTGEMKLGCVLGDHVKTGIGVMLNTGTVVGVGSNLFGATQPPKYVPAFSWGSGSDLVRYRLDRFLDVAERAMSRRQVPLTPGMRAILEAAWLAEAH